MFISWSDSIISIQYTVKPRITAKKILKSKVVLFQNLSERRGLKNGFGEHQDRKDNVISETEKLYASRGTLAFVMGMRKKTRRTLRVDDDEALLGPAVLRLSSAGDSHWG